LKQVDWVQASTSPAPSANHNGTHSLSHILAELPMRPPFLRDCPIDPWARRSGYTGGMESMVDPEGACPTE